MPLDELFNIKSYTTAREYTDDHHHDHHDHDRHDTEIKSSTIALPPLSPDRITLLNDFLEVVLWGETLPGGEKKVDVGVEILRTKGFIMSIDNQSYVLQGVTDVFELKQVRGHGEGKIVFIGRNVHLVGDSLKTHLNL